MRNSVLSKINVETLVDVYIHTKLLQIKWWCLSTRSRYIRKVAKNEIFLGKHLKNADFKYMNSRTVKLKNR